MSISLGSKSLRISTHSPQSISLQTRTSLVKCQVEVQESSQATTRCVAHHYVLLGSAKSQWSMLLHLTLHRMTSRQTWHHNSPRAELHHVSSLPQHSSTKQKGRAPLHFIAVEKAKMPRPCTTSGFRRFGINVQHVSAQGLGGSGFWGLAKTLEPQAGYGYGHDQGSASWESFGRFGLSSWVWV